LPEGLLSLSVFSPDETAVAIPVFDTLNDEDERFISIEIFEFGDHHFVVFVEKTAVPLLPRWWFAGQRCACRYKVNAIEILYELNHVAAFSAAAAIPDTFSRIDGEAILATTFWARTASLDAALQFYASPFDLALDRDCTGFVPPVVKGECWHRFSLE
jgi:hypothetical protein